MLPTTAPPPFSTLGVTIPEPDAAVATVDASASVSVAPDEPPGPLIVAVGEAEQDPPALVGNTTACWGTEPTPIHSNVGAVEQVPPDRFTVQKE